jgi:hypothetical protein
MKGKQFATNFTTFRVHFRENTERCMNFLFLKITVVCKLFRDISCVMNETRQISSIPHSTSLKSSGGGGQSFGVRMFLNNFRMKNASSVQHSNAVPTVERRNLAKHSPNTC